MTLPELKDFFQSRQLPDSIALSKAEYISDLKRFLKSHFTIAEARAGIPAFSSFHARLEIVRDILLDRENKTA